MKTLAECEAIVSRPGKFEGCKRYAPYFYDWALEGEGDCVYDYNGNLIHTLIEIDDDDIKIFPELKGIYAIALSEDDNGFIYTDTYSEEDARRTETLNSYDYWSAGICAGCDECQRDWNMAEDELSEAVSNGDICDEGHFSWSPCEICGSSLGGNRYHVHARDMETDEIIHFEGCTDCVMSL